MYCQSQKKTLITLKAISFKIITKLKKIVVLSDARHFDGGYHKDQMIVSHFLIIDWGKENTGGNVIKNSELKRLDMS